MSPFLPPWPPVLLSRSSHTKARGLQPPWAQSQDAYSSSCAPRDIPCPSQLMPACTACASVVSPVLPVAPAWAIFLTTMPLIAEARGRRVAGHAGTDWLLVPLASFS